MKKYMSIILFLMLCVASLFSLYVPTVHAARDIYVNSAYFGIYGPSDGSVKCPYRSIQKAIDESSTDDIIYVFGGTYDETLVISKKVTLWGGIGSSSIIDTRNDERYTVSITADDVVFQNFTISDIGNHKASPIGALLAIQANNVQVSNNSINDTKSYGIYIDGSSEGSVIFNNYINSTNHGIHITNSDTTDVIHNNISNCTTYGIYVSNSRNSRLYDNIIETSLTGVEVVSSTSFNVTNNTIRTTKYAGLYIEDSTGNIVKQNVFNNTTGTAFYLAASNSQIYDNNFSENERGITLAGFSSIIFNNTFWNQTAAGIYATSNSKANILYKNHFIDNGKSAEDLGDNVWYYQEQGNYYSDYKILDGIDRDVNGIGDTPYSNNGVVDNFPLGYFLKPPNKPSDPSPEDSETSVGLKITFKVTVEDDDDDLMTVYFYQYLENDTDFLIGTVKRVKSGENASCHYIQAFNTTFLWYVVVNDSLLENKSDIWYFTTMVTPSDNMPPIANTGGPYTAKPGQTLQLDASQSADPDGNISYYRWNFGDGTSEILPEQPKHMYKSVGDYTLTLTVIDDVGDCDIESTAVTISGNPNVHPTANANGPYKGVVGSSVIFSSTNSTDSDGELVSYSWDFGNGLTGNDMIGVQSYDEPGTYLVILTVTDDAGDSSSAQTTVTITEPETPGFEMILLIIAGIMLLIIFKRKQRRS